MSGMQLRVPAALATPTLEQDLDAAKQYARTSRARKTRIAYAQQWGLFASYCAANNAQALPADGATVAAWLASRASAGLALATLAQGLAAISAAHVRARHPDPRRMVEVREVWLGMRRALGAAPKRQAAPVMGDQLRALVEALPDTLTGKRDRALLLVGFASALRRQELTALQVPDLEWAPQGVSIAVRRSKTDQVGRGRVVGIPRAHGPHCPVLALRAWLDASGVQSGPVFRAVSRWGAVSDRLSPQAVNIVLKAAARRIGAADTQISAHSLRAGFCTAASEAGIDARSIALQTGHADLRTVNTYIRSAEIWTRNPASGLL